MKFSLLAILLLIVESVFAQTHSEKEIKDLLSHKWKAIYMEEDGQKIPTPGEWLIDLKTDGTLIMFDFEGQTKGKWSYSHKTKTLTTTLELDPRHFDVVKVSETELVLKITEDGVTMTMYMKRVN